MCSYPSLKIEMLKNHKLQTGKVHDEPSPACQMLPSVHALCSLLHPCQYQNEDALSFLKRVDLQLETFWAAKLEMSKDGSKNPNSSQIVECSVSKSKDDFIKKSLFLGGLRPELVKKLESGHSIAYLVTEPVEKIARLACIEDSLVHFEVQVRFTVEYFLFIALLSTISYKLAKRHFEAKC